MVGSVDGDSVAVLGHRCSFIFCCGDRFVEKFVLAQLVEGLLGLGLSSSRHLLSIVALMGFGIVCRVRVRVVRVEVEKCHFGLWLIVCGWGCRVLGQCSVRVANLDVFESFYLS